MRMEEITDTLTPGRWTGVEEILMLFESPPVEHETGGVGEAGECEEYPFASGDRDATGETAYGLEEPMREEAARTEAPRGRFSRREGTIVMPDGKRGEHARQGR
jgi:hypothetical protein